MRMEEIQKMLLSQPAVLIYEILLLAVLLGCIAVLTKKRRQRRKIRMTVQERQIHRSLDDSLSNQRRR